MLIEYCTLNCGDDCFTLKSGRGEEAARMGKPTENVVIRFSLAQQRHGGITCESETAGNIKNIYAHNGIINCKQIIPRLNDVDGFTLNNLKIHSQDNKINILDGRNILFKNIKFIATKDEIRVYIKGEQSKNIRFKKVHPNVKTVVPKN